MLKFQELDLQKEFMEDVFYKIVNSVQVVKGGKTVCQSHLQMLCGTIQLTGRIHCHETV